jgi:DNA mismatch endonuclease, patch repair protein
LRSSRPSRVNEDRGATDRGLTFAGPDSKAVKPSSREASRRMKKVRRADTSAEMQVRRLLHARGLRYRVDCPVLSDKRRRVDIAFPSARVAVFVDGCFWHGCPEHATWPASNAGFWRQKIETNRRRDRDTDEQLRKAGWQVIRIWEHEDPEQVATQVETLVRSAQSRPRS